MLNIIIFKNIFSKKVKFDDGSYIEWFNREAIRYVSGKVSLTMNLLYDWERDSSSGRLLNINEIENWDAPYNMEKISVEEREGILKKVELYCNKKGISCRFLSAGDSDL